MKLILIADDYFDLAETIGEVLSAALGVEVVTAINGKAAVEIALASRPDIVLLDVDMPVLDGIEAARRIRNALGEHCPVLIAHSGGVNADRARHSGMFDFFVQKPTDFGQLLELLDAS